MIVRILALAAILAMAGCAAPVWVTAASVSAMASTGTAVLVLDDEALKVWEDDHRGVAK